jgi:hypothetical protein
MHVDDVERVLAEPGRRKWLIASTQVLSQPNSAVDDGIKRFLLAQDAAIAYVGRDGDRKVYRFQ